ncbi:hypothetical protein FB567DRAFT_511316 [Paraphoma chrysanthemicola]|uniref:NACHT domain-containing protein n=1 Tax=Paraphoma chrysanthemicola TaxID=798071 RepID=A0A8K0RKA6_9PLEO|nr:hypothetical protein FB567DRAFT_511316 [Paraphoma chrysanthemicola]
MAETVAVVASIIAIIQISDRVIGCCKFYIQSTTDTPTELRVILVEISTLKTVLESLQFLQTCAHAAPALWKQLSGQDGPIEECKRSITALEKLFPAGKFPVSRSQPGPKRRKMENVRTALAWPLKARQARELLRVIIQQKTIINLALTTESSQDIKLIKKDTTDICSKLTESQQREIYRWLEKTDPSPLHNRAWKLHEQETSSWMLRSPEWNEWLAGNLRCLWVHGIPGAGKTILASFLVEQLKCHCKHRKRIAFSYYYCYFGHNQDEASPFLSWTISQLCRQAQFVPDLVHELFRQGGQPSLTELLLALEASLQKFDVAYVVLDAADESKPREDLLRVLRDLASDARFSKIRCLVTSRKYIDIEQALEPISRSVPMSNGLVEDDIRMHVRSILRSKPKFQLWPADLLIEVEKAVVDGSKGMFRWAICQLERLQRLKCERRIIDKALKTLPKTLDETYERILMEIPKDEWPFTRHALQWICFHQDLYYDDHALSLQILLAATESSTCREVEQEIDLEYNAERLRNMLGCLVNVDDNDLVILAHYTVQEYLESPRTSQSVTSYFWTGQESLMKDCIQNILREAQTVEMPDEEINSRGPGTPQAFLEDFSVYCVVSGCMLLLTRQSVLASDEMLLQLAVTFVNPSSCHYPAVNWISDAVDRTNTFFLDYSNNGFATFRLPSWEVQPDCIETATLLHFMLLSYHSGLPILADAFSKGKNVSKILQSQVSFSMVFEAYEPWEAHETYKFNGSFLEVTAQLSSQYDSTLEWLLDQCDAAFDTSLLQSIVGFGHSHFDGGKNRCTFQRILSRQADPNAAEYLVTPLQIAVAIFDVPGVTHLLEAGADSNATGTRNGIAFKTNSVLERFNELHGLSPLFICRTEHVWVVNNDTVENKPVIEALLLQHGAREYETEEI